jgi:dolichol-phosphate mannosyltransferase
MRSLVVVPTYNERENLSALIESIQQFAPEAHVLIVDDNSPDRTGDLADQLCSAQPERVFVIHRPRKQGLGPAYIEGFKFALARDYDLIMHMDADFSHDPKFLPQFFERIADSDLVVGSRYLNGISVVNWDLKRLMLSKAATAYIRLITSLPVTDATSGFKLWRREVLAAIDLNKLRSNGYVFLAEMSYQAFRQGFKINEVPIVFVERRLGRSKFNLGIITEALWGVLRMRLRK